ncbi:hypothetical protein Agub_g6949, partial [Astrephomene gubernaculifera]
PQLVGMYTAHAFVSRSQRLVEGLARARRACGSQGNLFSGILASYATVGDVLQNSSKEDVIKPGRTLVLAGVDPADELQRHLRTFASSFRIRELPSTSTRADVFKAASVRKPDRTLDRSHVVAVILKADRRVPEPEPEAGNDEDTNTCPWSSPSSGLGHVLELVRVARVACPHAFIILWHPDAVEDPEMRVSAFAAGVNMVSCYPEHVEEALGKLAMIGANPSPPTSSETSSGSGSSPSASGSSPSDPSCEPGTSSPSLSSSISAPSPSTTDRSCTCAWCGQTDLTPTELWMHSPLYHVYEENRGGVCCICDQEVDNLARHIYSAHRPSGPRCEMRRGVGSAVVIHRKRDNKFLMVQEFAGQGFWVPGGGTDPGESLRNSAIRECMEEAGVEVELKGLVELVYTLSPFTGKPTWRLAVFYATLKDEDAHLKTVPCFESAGACWVSVCELAKLPLRSERIPLSWFPRFAMGYEPKRLALPEELKELFADLEF